jgi:hypothetical protein
MCFPYIWDSADCPWKSKQIETTNVDAIRNPTACTTPSLQCAPVGAGLLTSQHPSKPYPRSMSSPETLQVLLLEGLWFNSYVFDNWPRSAWIFNEPLSTLVNFHYLVVGVLQARTKASQNPDGVQHCVWYCDWHADVHLVLANWYMPLARSP